MTVMTSEEIRQSRDELRDKWTAVRRARSEWEHARDMGRPEAEVAELRRALVIADGEARDMAAEHRGNVDAAVIANLDADRRGQYRRSVDSICDALAALPWTGTEPVDRMLRDLLRRAERWAVMTRETHDIRRTPDRTDDDRRLLDEWVDECAGLREAASALMRDLDSTIEVWGRP